MLNWRPVREIEARTNELRGESAKIAIEIEQIKNDSARIKSDTERIKNETEQIKSETEQLRRENARQKALSALIKQHCFPDDFSSTPLPPTEPDTRSF